jgi:hypothetical protein
VFKLHTACHNQTLDCVVITLERVLITLVSVEITLWVITPMDPRLANTLANKANLFKLFQLLFIIIYKLLFTTKQIYISHCDLSLVRLRWSQLPASTEHSLLVFKQNIH